MKKHFIILLAISFCGLFIHAQNTDKTLFKSYEPGFYQNSILKDIREQKSKKQAPAKKYFRLDFSGKDFPVNIADYTVLGHLLPHSQGSTGTCWCFATISMLESEVLRKTSKELGLSEMYIVYHEYIARARAFVQNRGDISFTEGSEATSVLRMMNRHGIVPREVFSGMPKEAKFHNHKALFQEMDDYLISVKNTNAWNEEAVAETIEAILNKHLGTPPDTFVYDGKSYTPQDFMADYCQLNPRDYFSFMSTMSQNFNEKGELVEADNWWHCDDYYNLSMHDFLGALTESLEKGYSVTVCGDISEVGFDKNVEVGIIPDFDIPQEYISNEARQFRLSNGSTTDDHCMHAVGFQKTKDHFWVLVKDSGAGGFDGENKGYRFIRDDYIKLKMMNLMMNKEGARSYLDKIIK